MGCVSPVLGIILSTFVSVSFSLISPPELIAREALLKVWQNCIGDSLSRIFEAAVKEAEKQCQNSREGEINSAKDRDSEDRLKENVFDVDRGQTSNDISDTADKKSGFGSGRNDSRIHDSDSYDRNNDDRYYDNNYNSYSDSNEYQNNSEERLISDLNSDDRNRGDTINNSGDSFTNDDNKRNKDYRGATPFIVYRNGDSITTDGTRRDGNRKFNVRNSVRQNNRTRDGSGASGFPSLGLPRDSRPIYFSLIDQIPFLLQGDGPGVNLLARSKRQSDLLSPPRFTVQELIEGENKLKTHLSNLSCVLRKLDLTDAEGNLQLSHISDNIAGFPIDADLRDDLLQVVQDCFSLVNCLPQDDADTIVPLPLKKAYAFFQCSEHRRQLACMKKDIRSDLRTMIPNDRLASFDMERTVTRIMYIKMANSFSDITSAFSYSSLN